MSKTKFVGLEIPLGCHIESSYVVDRITLADKDEDEVFKVVRDKLTSNMAANLTGRLIPTRQDEIDGGHRVYRQRCFVFTREELEALIRSAEERGAR